jgi:hypothetical protein
LGLGLPFFRVMFPVRDSFRIPEVGGAPTPEAVAPTK